MAFTKEVTYGGSKASSRTLLRLRDGNIHRRNIDSDYHKLLQAYPHRDRAKNFVFYSQSQNKARDVTDEQNTIQDTTHTEEVSESTTSTSLRHSGSKNPKVVLYSKQSWIKDFLEQNALDASAQSYTDDGEVEIDVDILIEYLMTQGFAEEDLQFLKTNLDYGFDQIEKELRKIKENNNKSKHISIGREDGKDEQDKKEEHNNKEEHDNKSPKNNSNSLKVSFKVLCLTFIFVTYII